GCQLGGTEDEPFKSGHFFARSQGTGEAFAIFGPQAPFGDLQGLEAAGGGDELPHVLVIGFREKQTKDESRQPFDHRPVQKDQKKAGDEGDEEGGDQRRRKGSHGCSILIAVWEGDSSFIFPLCPKKDESLKIFGKGEMIRG